MTVTLTAQQRGFYEDYVLIRTDDSVFIVPFEATVVRGGIHPNPESLAFGTLTSTTQKRTLSLSVLNSGPQVVQVQQVTTLTPDPHVSISSRFPVLLPGVVCEVLGDIIH